MKNSNITIGNGTRDLPTCRAVPQPTTPPRDPYRKRVEFFNVTLGDKLLLKVSKKTLHTVILNWRAEFTLFFVCR